MDSPDILVPATAALPVLTDDGPPWRPADMSLLGDPDGGYRWSISFLRGRDDNQVGMELDARTGAILSYKEVEVRRPAPSPSTDGSLQLSRDLALL